MDEQQIIELFLQRDKDAISETERKYTNYCKRIATQILQNPEDTEETLNDTWLAAWNCIPPHIPERLQTFLGKLTRNISLKRFRTQHTQKRGAGEVCVVFDEIAEWLGSGQDIEREVCERAVTDAINIFLDTLSETERSIFVRRYWYFQSIAEISECYGFSESKVKSLLLRIRKRLYAKLEKEDLL